MSVPSTVEFQEAHRCLPVPVDAPTTITLPSEGIFSGISALKAIEVETHTPHPQCLQYWRESPTLLPPNTEGHVIFATGRIYTLSPEESCQSNFSSVRNHIDQLDTNDDLTELDEIANEAELTLEYIHSKMMKLLSGVDIPYDATPLKEISDFSGKHSDYICEYTLTDASALLNAATLKLKGKLPEIEIDPAGRGNIDITWSFESIIYNWLVMKSDNRWPMIRVLVTSKEYGRATNNRIFYNSDSLLADLVEKVDVR